MSPRVFLHVGLPKSGTTFLQRVLVTNRDRLAEAGLLFPGPHAWADHVRAARDLREMPYVRRHHRRRVPGAWDRLAEEICRWDGDAIVSMEWLSRVEPHQVARVMDSFATREVHVVFTVRDLARMIPASWQESVLNRKEWSWSEYLAEISTDQPGVPRSEQRFWRLHDLLPLIGRWTGAVPPESVHVVTVPPSGAPLATLWDRFSGVLGVTGVPVELTEVARNERLGLASTELMRRLNVRSREAGLAVDVHKPFLTQQLAKRGLALQRTDAARPTIPPELHAWVVAQAEETIAGLRAAGVDVVGDLADLRPDLSDHDVETPEPDAETLLDVALDALVVMAEQGAARRARAETDEQRLVRRNKRLRRQQAATAARLARWQARPLRSALRAYARRSAPAVRLVRRLRRGGRS